VNDSPIGFEQRIALSIVSVLPRPITSASIPPRPDLSARDSKLSRKPRVSYSRVVTKYRQSIPILDRHKHVSLRLCGYSLVLAAKNELNPFQLMSMDAQN
jgi:hypothetical protein